MAMNINVNCLKNRKLIFQPLIGWCLALLVITVPYSAALGNIFSISIVIFWLVGGTVKEDCRLLIQQPFVKVLVLFLTLVCFSLLWTEAEIGIAFDALRKFRKILFLFVCWVYLWRENIWIERLLTLMLVSFGIMALLCVGVYFGMPGLPEPIPGQGAVLSRSHISQGYIMAILVVMGLSYALNRNMNKIFRAVSGGCAVIAILVTFFMTQGRTGYVCIMAAFVFVAVGFNCSLRKKVFLALFSGILVVFLAVSSPNVVSRMSEVKSDVNLYLSGDVSTSSGLRLSFWINSLEMLKDNPVLGVGVGGWSITACQQTQKGANTQSCLHQKGPGNPHSDIWNFASQFGIVGCFCWIAFLLIWLNKAWNITDPSRRMMAIGFFGVYLIGGMVNSFFWDVIEGILLCITIALVMATGNESSRSKLCFRNNIVNFKFRKSERY